MNLKPLGANRTEVDLGNATVLFSYRTPVACSIAGQGFFKTKTKWSRTTSKHITQWLHGYLAEADEKEQSFFDSLIKEVNTNA